MPPNELARLIASHLHIAREDLTGARLLAKAKNRNAAHLCEQAAEKIIRAVLTAEGSPGGMEHSPGQMVAMLPDANILKAELALLAPLAAYATSYRYPTSTRVPPGPGERELDEHLDRVDAVLTRTAAAFGVDFAADTVAKTPQPPR